MVQSGTRMYSFFRKVLSLFIALLAFFMVFHTRRVASWRHVPSTSINKHSSNRYVIANEITTEIHSTKSTIPTHVAYIVDGNGRWGVRNQQQNANRSEGPSARSLGHRKGAEVTVDIVKATFAMGVDVTTLFLFSTENWARPIDEVNNIMQLLHTYLLDFSDYLEENKIELHVIGQKHLLPPFTQTLLSRIGHKDNTGISSNSNRNSNGVGVGNDRGGRRDDMSERNISSSNIKSSSNGDSSSNSESSSKRVINSHQPNPHPKKLCLAISYGGRDDIVNSCKDIAQQLKRGLISAEDIDEDLFHQHTSLGQLGIPDPDLIIRTSGEFRLSNFLLWQSAYAELASADCLWPDFSTEEAQAMILSFASRDRRYGQIND